MDISDKLRYNFLDVVVFMKGVAKIKEVFLRDGKISDSTFALF
jgi:hypothetical protein